MSDGFSFRQKPKGLFKWFLQTPKWLYRAHLGFLLGSRFLLLEHKGRKSDLLRQTPLEIAHHDPVRDEYIVTSGTGVKADWYRNIQASPAVGIWLGNHRYAVIQRFLPTEEAVEVMRGYEREHPKAAAKLESMMGVSHDETQESWMTMMGRIPMIGFKPQR